MRLSETLRNSLFWILDTLQGGQVKRHYADIQSVLTDRDGVHAKITARLQHILRHASDTTEFYQAYSGKPIESFPVIDKNIIRERMEEFFSSSYGDLARIPVITSGSTGTPFKTFQHRDKKSRNTADTLYFAGLAGYELGNKLYYFKIWSAYNRKPSWLQRLQHIVPIDVLNLKASARDVIAALNRNTSPVSFLGYVSAIETLCKELDHNPSLSITLKVKSIITMSEGLNDYTRKRGGHYFSCPVLSRYSNIENGILAQQTLESREAFVINRASYYVEILALEGDQVVPEGTLGRIVVTDYYNEAMPLIRYDTGDLGVMESREIAGVPHVVLSRVEGRKLDQIYNTKGELISSYIVYKNMWKYTELEQYQFVQKGAREYVFKVCIPGVFERECELVAEFKAYLGEDADFRVEYVQEIPLLASGKRKKVVNETHA